jgi:sporulenol synthase
MLERREDDGSVAGYHSSTVLMLFALRALGYERQHREIRRALSALRRTYYTDETKRFYHQQTCDGHVWNTALAANALLGAGVKPEHPAIKGSVHYLLEKQHSRSGDWLRNNPVEPGGWGFSSNNTRHPDVDDTVAVLDVLAVCQNHGVKIGQPLQKGIRWLLGMQNDDGGWSAFDRNCNKQWMEKLPANDMERTIVDPSTADITGRVVDFLIRNQVVSPGSRVIHKAIRWLQENQEADGSWYGRWGTTYIYGTWCVLKGLCTAGVSSGDAALQRSKDWLLQIQRGDGGFGESCESALAGTFIPLHISLPSQTSWGLDALLHLYDVEKAPLEKHRLARACQRAARYLLNSGENGVWSEDMPTGTGFPGSLHIRYHIYPRVWPLAALAHYNRTFNQFDGYSHANLERR